MKSTIILSAGLILACANSAAAEDLFIPTVHILTTKGTYERNVIQGGNDGMPRIACEMKLDAWEAEFGDLFKQALKELAGRGEFGAFRTTCEKK